MVARRAPVAAPPVSAVLTAATTWRDLLHPDEVTVAVAHRLAAAVRWSTPSPPVAYRPEGHGWHFTDTTTGEVLGPVAVLDALDAWLLAAGPALRGWCWHMATRATT